MPTDPESVFVSCNRLIIERIQGPQTVQGDELVTILELRSDLDLDSVGLWTSTKRRRSTFFRPRILSARGESIVKVNGGFDEINVRLDMRWYRVRMAAWE